MRPATRRALIAGTAVLGSVTAAVLACTALRLPPDSRQGLESVVPGLFGLDVITIVALLPTVVVSGGVTLAVFLETALQISAVHQRRLELEGRTLEAE